MNIERIAELERINYLTMEPAARVTPGSEVILRPDVILTSSQIYPAAEANHACLLRTDPPNADALIDEVIAYFRARQMPSVVMLSPACQPADWVERLQARGFQRQESDETWVVMEDVQKRKVPFIEPNSQVKQIGREDAPLFAEVMAAAYEMPPEYVPALAEAVAPSIGLPGIAHFLAFMDKKPIATLTLMRYENYVTVGSAGVLPNHRGSRTIFNMAVEVLAEARRQGAETLLGQTVLGPLFERFLRICGFQFAFRRVTFVMA